MASSSNSIDGTESVVAAQPKVGLVPLILSMVAAVVASVGLLAGAGYFLVKSGRLALPGNAAAPVAAKVEPVVVPATHSMALEPMVVNLADENGKSFLRLGLTLVVQDPQPKKGDKLKEEKPKEAKGPNETDAEVRDVALEVVGRQTAAGLLVPEGKKHLKEELKEQLKADHPALKVSEVFFTEFLVQR
jgi:flagellar FliL protein